MSFQKRSNSIRSAITLGSICSLARRTGDELKYGRMSVRFYNEEGVDAGGVTKVGHLSQTTVRSELCSVDRAIGKAPYEGQVHHCSSKCMLQKNIDGIFQLTFSVEADDFGSTRVVDLSPGGREIPATSKTKAMFNYLSKID
ncbi:hypothetical protein PCANC_10742 [Puccinia coronata f. sp. avenae]|uniref:HECT-type E3 ubiquitin transferase n=1 Tax=Puccinia coronata f. sp. avenae TaxID=200324 RepID=A0A2N5VST1_9BASI|nr:hypothetical protein PCANC_10742 [Puccinia coronata f. sp. avenae]